MTDSCQSSHISNFPYHVMTGAAGIFANIYSDNIEVPEEFLFMSYLTCLGSALCSSIRLKSLLPTQPRLYTVLVGESATDRKSTCLNIATRHFKNVILDFNVRYGIGSPEGLQKIVENEDTVTLKPTGTLLCFDEFKSFVDKASIRHSVLLPCINTLFESNVYENATKKTHLKVSNAYLSILGATTTATYESIYSDQFIDIGFPNRIFLVPGTANKEIPIPPVLDESDEMLLNDALKNILQFVGGDLELEITDDARQLYNEWYPKLRKSIFGKRLDTYSLRLMMLLAVNDLKKVIDSRIMTQAINLCDWQHEVREFYDPIDAADKVSRMEQKIRRVVKRAHVIHIKELKRKVNYSRDGIWAWDKAFKGLIQEKEIQINKNNGLIALCED